MQLWNAKSINNKHRWFAAMIYIIDGIKRASMFRGKLELTNNIHSSTAWNYLPSTIIANEWSFRYTWFHFASAMSTWQCFMETSWTSFIRRLGVFESQLVKKRSTSIFFFFALVSSVKIAKLTKKKSIALVLSTSSYWNPILKPIR